MNFPVHYYQFTSSQVEQVSQLGCARTTEITFKTFIKISQKIQFRQASLYFARFSQVDQYLDGLAHILKKFHKLNNVEIRVCLYFERVSQVRQSSLA